MNSRTIRVDADVKRALEASGTAGDTMSDVVRRLLPTDPHPHPMQPIINLDNVVRFRGNPIVSFLLDNGPYDMNRLAVMNFSAEDRQHFAQLIGYSVCGYCELSYVDDPHAEAAIHIAAKVKL